MTRFPLALLTLLPLVLGCAESRTARQPADAGPDDGIERGDGDQASDGMPDTLCAMVCAQDIAVGCPRILPNCEPTCEMFLLGRCGAPQRAFLACAAKRPLSDFACAPVGRALINEGVCPDEKKALDACRSQSMGPPP